MSTWQTESGEVMRIEDMTTTHIVNSMALIERAMANPTYRFHATLQLLQSKWMVNCPDDVWDEVVEAIEAGDYTQILPWQDLNREYQKRQEQDRAAWRARRAKEQSFT